MSDQKQARHMDTGHPSGLSPSDSGQSKEELEGSAKAFRRAPSDGGIEHKETAEVQSAAEESRREAGFIAVEEHPTLDAQRGAPIVHEDPERLERQRVDQDDEIVAVYDPATDSEKAVLRPRISKKGAESEGL
jgi:hypothetical protein